MLGEQFEITGDITGSSMHFCLVKRKSLLSLQNPLTPSVSQL